MNFPLTLGQYLWAAGLIWTAATIQGAMGFGLALIAAPLLLMTVPMLVPGPLICISLVLMSLVCYRDFHSVDRPGLVWGKRRIMEVYLNVAETGIGTYGAEAGAQRYFGHSAARLTRDEAARMAAVLPQPKKRAVIAPSGFTRRYGNTIAARMGAVRRDGLDTCVYE